ncbi:MAG: hypothetical protein ABIH08_06880 [Candidatus Omnitrophota bacterium]
MKRLILFTFILLAIGCVGGRQVYLTTEHKDKNYIFEFLSPAIGSITLPGDPDAWVKMGMESGWFTFYNEKSNDTVQYINTKKESLEFYTKELSTNENLINGYYEWEKEYLAKSPVVESAIIIEKEINEDSEDYILFEVVRNDGRNHFIYSSIRDKRVTIISLQTNDPEDIALKNIIQMYNSTKQ